MANWTNSSWQSASTVADRITQGNAFLAEILEKIAGADVSAHGYARNTANLLRLYELTEKALNQLKASTVYNGGLGLASFTRPR